MRVNLRVSGAIYLRSEQCIQLSIGQIVKIGGIDSYVVTPQGDYPKDKVVLFLTDVFGIPLVNNKVHTYSIYYYLPIKTDCFAIVAC